MAVDSTHDWFEVAFAAAGDITDVTATLAVLSEQSAPGSCLVVNYQTRLRSSVGWSREL